MILNLLDSLRRDEGEVLKVYKDSRGILTAGVGHNLQAHPNDPPYQEGDIVTQAQSDFWLQQDASAACDQVHKYLPWTDDMDTIRRAVLQNMCFNMGIIKLLGFHHFLGFTRNQYYMMAKPEMLSSLWAKEVGSRATRLATQLVTGVWQ